MMRPSFNLRPGPGSPSAAPRNQHAGTLQGILCAPTVSKAPCARTVCKVLCACTVCRIQGSAQGTVFRARSLSTQCVVCRTQCTGYYMLVASRARYALSMRTHLLDGGRATGARGPPKRGITQAGKSAPSLILLLSRVHEGRCAPQEEDRQSATGDNLLGDWSIAPAEAPNSRGDLGRAVGLSDRCRRSDPDELDAEVSQPWLPRRLPRSRTGVDSAEWPPPPPRLPKSRTEDTK